MRTGVKTLFRFIVIKLQRNTLLRRFFIPSIYKKANYISELNLTYLSKKKNIDESYWVAKIRQYAHVVDKGLHRGNFTKGRGKTSLISTKEALSNIVTESFLSDPAVKWAKVVVSNYDEMNRGSLTRINSPYIASKCSTDNLITTIQGRRSIRHFQRKKITPQDISEIASVLDWAPTSCHRQPGRLYAISNKEKIKKCIDLHIGAACFSDVYVPIFLIFCADARLYDMPNEINTPCIDVALGAQNCFLVAYSKGISITPLIWTHQGDSKETFLRKMLGIPEYYQIVMGAAAGYPSSGSRIPTRKKTDLILF